MATFLLGAIVSRGLDLARPTDFYIKTVVITVVPIVAVIALVTLYQVTPDPLFSVSEPYCVYFSNVA